MSKEAPTIVEQAGQVVDETIKSRMAQLDNFMNYINSHEDFFPEEHLVGLLDEANHTLHLQRPDEIDFLMNEYHLFRFGDKYTFVKGYEIHGGGVWGVPKKKRKK